MQVGIPYELVGPDGTRAVFNDSDDPDFVGFLDAENGIAGLDGADIREEATELTERDGGAHGPFYAGRMPFSLSGIIPPILDVADTTRREQKFKRATKALRADGTFRWQPVGDTEREVRFRRNTKPVISGRRVKQFQVGLVSASHAIYATSESSLVIVAGASAGVLGFGSPITSPLSSESGQTGATIVANLGDEPTPPRFRVDGPITNPVIRNATLDEEIRIVYTLAAGEWLDIDGEIPSVLLNGTVDRYRSVQFPGTSWWKLDPGANDVRLLASAFSNPAQLTVYWRDAWA